MRYFYLFFLMALFTQCSEDDLRIAFQMNYPQNRFTVPPGLNTLESHYVFFRDVPTNKNEFFGDIPEEDIQEISPASARIRGDQNIADFAFAQEIVVRVCEDNTANINNVLEKCRREIFFRDNIPLNTGREVELIANLNNLRTTLTEDRFTFVLVFLRNRAFTGVSTPANLEMNFAARR